MSLGPNETLKEELSKALDKAGLPADPTRTLGRAFSFECEHGSHHRILVGTITGMELSDEGGLRIYTSIPQFWGSELRHFSCQNGEWTASVVHHGSKLPREVYPGEFQLI